MTKIIMNGACGRMGKVIAGLVQNREDAEIVAGVDIADDGMSEFPVFTDINMCDTEADVIIDFSSPSVTDKVIDYAVKKQIPAIICTTGLSSEQRDYIRKASKNVAILMSGNMSLGINTIISMLKNISDTFCKNGFDVDIVEQHHNNKLDAPSGTALMLADAINDAEDGRYEYVYDRSARREKRPKDEIGISSVRAGSIPGIHEVIFAGPDEVIEIKHTAYSRAVFGNGAVCAAVFLAGKEPGMYDMNDVIASR